jgi:hypothetical protein
LQLDIAAQGVVPLAHPDNQIFDSRADIGYLVSDRWSVGMTGTYSRSIEDETAVAIGRLQGTGWFTTVAAFLEVYLEDRMSLVLSANDFQLRQRIGTQPLDTYEYRRSSQVALTFSYRLAGQFNAPGLLTPTLGRSSP